MPAHGVSLRKYIELTPPSTSQYDVKASAAGLIAGSDVVINVGNAVVLSNTLTTGFAWPADCTLRINILDGGKVQARGGNGANYVTASNGSAGHDGSDGILVQDGTIRVTLHIVGTGVLQAGGGGGGSGAADTSLGSGPGGGGAGTPGGSAGTVLSGAPASNGTANGGGAGGSGTILSAAGGKGGGVAGDGAAGKDTGSRTGGRGGDAGAAYRATGFLPPIMTPGTNTSAHIKGLIVT
jgi:hypothetical protein